MFYDWAGGLIWVAMPFADEPDAGCDPRARSASSAATPRWCARRPRCAPRSTCSSRRRRALPRLSKRVKEGFDPKGVLNPGRMWAGV